MRAASAGDGSVWSDSSSARLRQVCNVTRRCHWERGAGSANQAPESCLPWLTASALTALLFRVWDQMRLVHTLSLSDFSLDRLCCQSDGRLLGGEWRIHVCVSAEL